MEFNKNSLEFVVNVLNQNNIKYNPKVEKYFNDEPSVAQVRDLASDYFKLLYDLSVDGINNGFNKKVILELTDQIVAQQHPRADRHLKDNQKVYERLLKDGKLKGNIEKDNVLAATLSALVTDTIKGAKLFVKSENNLKDEHKQVIEQGINQLENILSEIENVFDYSSKEAVLAYNEAYENIEKWANEVAGSFITNNLNSILDNAKESIERWQRLLTNSKTAKEVKAKEYTTTNLDRYEKCYSGAINDVEGIRTAFEIRKVNLEKHEAEHQELIEKFSKQSAHKNELLEEKENIRKQYKNGELDRDLALSRLEFNKTQIEAEDEVLQDIKDEMQSLNDALSIERKEILEFDKMFKRIDKMKEQPLKFYYVVLDKNIKIDLIKKLFSGELRQEDEIKYAVFQINQLENGYNTNKNTSADIINALRGKKYVTEINKDVNKAKNKEVVHDKELESFLDGDVKEKQTKTEIDDLDIDETINIHSNKQ